MLCPTGSDCQSIGHLSVIFTSPTTTTREQRLTELGKYAPWWTACTLHFAVSTRHHRLCPLTEVSFRLGRAYTRLAST
ncbi:TPA: hypothetical protein N0F65_011242 [Lagenidium giganteum]|uniref:Uncharacterized protein n=1 Tax=Lagenidium giganteum TaxID=4803 RepID=A0AAV2YWF4_9STRA|nr:TPA: hypothetical protein N0F65_011242 [Lagenidium giganteum]